MKIERGTRVDLLRVNYECRARWRSGPPGSYRERFIRVGLLADGRWFVDMNGQGGDCRAYRTKAEAWAVIQRLMQAFGEQPWEQISCYGTPLGRRSN